MTIKLNGYSKLLAEIKQCLTQAQDKLINTVTRQKVVTSWQIGKFVEQHLKKNNRANYGEKVFEQLARDISISQRVLYQMRSFYQTYPKLPKDNNRLNWSHYQTLSGIKENDKRKYFESLAQQQNWDVKTLELEVKKSEPKEVSNSAKSTKKSSTTADSTKTKIRPERGQLHTYSVAKLGSSKKYYLDLGFKIFREVEGKLPKGASTVSVEKNGDGYIYKKSNCVSRQLNTYVAELERVVDGDTIHVILNLDCKTEHREIIRLAKINAPEMSTKEGKKSAAALTEILRDVPFLIVKSFRTDIYGRYIADIFFDEKKSKTANPQTITNEGTYLNQLLLDRGLVELY